jgi:hypothetical protein
VKIPQDSKGIKNLGCDMTMSVFHFRMKCISVGVGQICVPPMLLWSEDRETAAEVFEPLQGGHHVSSTEL